MLLQTAFLDASFDLQFSMRQSCFLVAARFDSHVFGERHESVKGDDICCCACFISQPANGYEHVL